MFWYEFERMKKRLATLTKKGKDNRKINKTQRGQVTVQLVREFQRIYQLTKNIENRFLSFLVKRNYFPQRMRLNKLNIRSWQLVVIGEDKVCKANFEDIEHQPFDFSKNSPTEDQYNIHPITTNEYYEFMIRCPGEELEELEEP